MSRTEVGSRVVRETGAVLRGDGSREPHAPFARYEAEALIAGAFAEVLGLEQVEGDDDFFDLGGTSLSAIEVLDRVRSLLAVDAAALDLLEAPTPARLAERVRFAAPRAVPDVVRLAGWSDPPVFLVPGGTGDGADLLVVARLARRIGADAAFLAVRAGSAPENPPGEQSRWVVDRIRSVQPSGPYRIVGECVGGILAYAAALRLRAEGESVGLLALLDTPFPEPGGRALRSFVGRRVPGVRGLLRRVRHQARVLRSLPSDRRLAYLRERLGRGDPALAPAVDSPQAEAARRRSAYGGGLLAWRPERYEGLVHLVECAESVPEGLAAAWATVAPRLDVVRVPGDHGTYIGENVDHVARALARWLAPDPIS